MSKNNAKGRSKGVRHVRLDHWVFYSPAYRALSPTGRTLLLELTALYNGRNNGDIFLGVRDAARLMGVTDKNTAAKALGELQAHGFIVPTRKGHFAVKQAQATAWRLTWLPLQSHSGPSNDFKHWQATPGTKAARRLIELNECNLRSEFSTAAVLKNQTDVTNSGLRDAAAGVNHHTVEQLVLGKSAMGDPRKDQTHIDSHIHGSSRATRLECQRAREIIRDHVRAVGRGGQGRLAASAGLSQSRLSRFLNSSTGRRTLTKDEVHRLYAALSRHGERALRRSGG